MLPKSKLVTAEKFNVTPDAVIPPNCWIWEVGITPPGLSVTPTNGPPANCGTQTLPPFCASNVSR